MILGYASHKTEYNTGKHRSTSQNQEGRASIFLVMSCWSTCCQRVLPSLNRLSQGLNMEVQRNTHELFFLILDVEMEGRPLVEPLCARISAPARPAWSGCTAPQPASPRRVSPRPVLPWPGLPCSPVGCPCFAFDKCET